jgi:hypothetical protein
VWAIGADIGQARDYTAIAVVEAARDPNTAAALALRHLERVPLRLSYPAIIEQIGAVDDAVPSPRALVVDATGVGRPVVDLLVAQQGRSLLGVVITAGSAGRGARARSATCRNRSCCGRSSRRWRTIG